MVDSRRTSGQIADIQTVSNLFSELCEFFAPALLFRMDSTWMLKPRNISPDNSSDRMALMGLNCQQEEAGREDCFKNVQRRTSRLRNR